MGKSKDTKSGDAIPVPVLLPDAAGKNPAFPAAEKRIFPAAYRII